MAAAAAAAAVELLLLSHLLWHPDVLECVAPDVDLRHAPEAVAILQTAEIKDVICDQLVAIRL
jgi:hypothetical protein